MKDQSQETDFERLNAMIKVAVLKIKDKKYDAHLKIKIIYIGLSHHRREISICWEKK